MKSFVLIRPRLSESAFPVGQVELYLRQSFEFKLTVVVCHPFDEMLALSQKVLDRPLGGGFSLPDLLSDVARHYLGRAMDESAGNKTRAAELVGLQSYQTLTNWLAKYEVSQ